LLFGVWMPQDVFTIDAKLLKRICPARANQAVLAAIPEACLEFDISTGERIAAFLAQMDHESDGFSRLVENLNYSAERLRAVFPRFFPTFMRAQTYAARGPQAIANLVYGGRIGNGDEFSGDGFRYRGRGLPQLTGLANYLRAEKALSLPLVAFPDKLLEPGPAARVGAWFWSQAGCNDLADAGDFSGITRAINGGLNGLPHRVELWNHYRGALGLGDWRSDATGVSA